MGHQPKLGSYCKNRIFWPKTEIFCPKKTFSSGHDREKLFKEKSTLYQNFCFLPKELGFLAKKGQIWPKIGIIGHFGTNIGIFGSFCPLPDQNTMRTKCLVGFSIVWVPKLLLSPITIWIFCPKTTTFGIFGHFGPGLAGYLGALLVGWLVVVACGLILARHLSAL